MAWISILQSDSWQLTTNVPTSEFILAGNASSASDERKEAT